MPFNVVAPHVYAARTHSASQERRLLDAATARYVTDAIEIEGFESAVWSILHGGDPLGDLPAYEALPTTAMLA